MEARDVAKLGAIDLKVKVIVNGHAGAAGGIKVVVYFIGAWGCWEGESLRLWAIVGGDD